MSLVVFRREVAKLSDKWSSLLAQLDTWQRRLDETLPVSQQLIQLILSMLPFNFVSIHPVLLINSSSFLINSSSFADQSSSFADQFIKIF